MQALALMIGFSWMFALSFGLVKQYRESVEGQRENHIRQWRRYHCGRFQAGRRNLAAAASHYSDQEQSHRARDQALMSWDMRYGSADCSTGGIEIYYQENPSLPDGWPNFDFRLGGQP